MRAEDLVFWLDQIGDRSVDDHGVLCQRHADTMVVPRNWTLDDLRDPDLHLFRPPPANTGKTRRVRRNAADVSTPPEQLELGSQNAPLADDSEVAQDRPSGSLDAEQSETWSPSFDSDSDLGGLLAARSPLLARAFRGDDRPRR
jgi:hypothetical protein